MSVRPPQTEDPDERTRLENRAAGDAFAAEVEARREADDLTLERARVVVAEEVLASPSYFAVHEDWQPLRRARAAFAGLLAAGAAGAGREKVVEDAEKALRTALGEAVELGEWLGGAEYAELKAVLWRSVYANALVSSRPHDRTELVEWTKTFALLEAAADDPAALRRAEAERRILRLVRPPMRGHDVRLAQRLLVRHGFGPLQADGVYGPRTAAATRRFQEAAGINADGVVGTRTWSLLLGDDALKNIAETLLQARFHMPGQLFATPPPGQEPVPPPVDPNLARIRELQAYLAKLRTAREQLDRLYRGKLATVRRPTPPGPLEEPPPAEEGPPRASGGTDPDRLPWRMTENDLGERAELREQLGVLGLPVDGTYVHEVAERLDVAAAAGLSELSELMSEDDIRGVGPLFARIRRVRVLSAPTEEEPG
ncbi:peptidoglycan-binding domain-containing protein [Nonomuraea insulae]|uniref:Peptidoglycan-binding protein n=1 Tax=Nonomuraea insulae TaxID=1616787 RepID=A0ABW1CUK1_9ACTN